jgi:hypothetical protein
MIKIEKNIKVPTARIKYPFGEMKVGDSFSLEGLNATSVYNAANSYGRGNGKKFAMRKLENVKRLWRIV